MAVRMKKLMLLSIARTQNVTQETRVQRVNIFLLPGRSESIHAQLPVTQGWLLRGEHRQRRCQSCLGFIVPQASLDD